MHPIRWLLVILVAFCCLATAEAAELQYPLSIAVKDAGEIYLADRNLPGIWIRKGDKLQVLFEGSKTFRTPLNAIRCVAIDHQGKLLAGDSSTREVYRFNEQGQPVGLTRKAPAPATEATKTKGKAVFGQIGVPMDIAVAKNGEIFVSDLELHRVVKLPAEGGDPVEFVSIQAPRGLCFDDAGNLWVVSGRQLVKISAKGEKATVVAEGVFEFPHTVAVAADQTAFVCDGYAKAIWKIPAGQKPTKLVSGDPMINPVGMRLAGDKLYVVDPRAKSVFQISLDGQLSPIALKP